MLGVKSYVTMNFALYEIIRDLMRRKPIKRPVQFKEVSEIWIHIKCYESKQHQYLLVVKLSLTM